jgi:hypothetical protein
MERTQKQTAVEWLVSKLLNGKPLMPSLIEQALAMEKEQIIAAYQAGDGDAYNLDDTDKWAEQYYEETFRGVDD